MYSHVDLTATVLNCCLPMTRHKLYRPKLARFSDNIITLNVIMLSQKRVKQTINCKRNMFAVNGLLYPYFM